jgi:hypothetical protein
MRFPRVREYPKQFYIGRDIYKLKFVRRVLSDHANAGCCDPERKEIRIKLGQTPKETLSTLIHELLHAAEFSYDIKISHEAIYRLEIAIMSFLQENT